MFSPDSQGQGVRAQVALSVFVNTAHAAVCRCYVLFLFLKTCKKEKHTCLTIACLNHVCQTIEHIRQSV